MAERAWLMRIGSVETKTLRKFMRVDQFGNIVQRVHTLETAQTHLTEGVWRGVERFGEVLCKSELS